jgi:HAD superfamily hydrolase (TIGR01549 family)
MTNSLLSDFQALFWDFDGVILNSNAVRDLGFEKVLSDYPIQEVDALLEYHRANGGLSRYVKFRYFFEKIKNEVVTEDKIQEYANKFSEIMKVLLTDKSLLIQETVRFIEKNYTEVPMFIVSGSDQEELRYLCNELGLVNYFRRIHGSPVPKTDWVQTILEEEELTASNCLLIGDSYNDYEAATANNMLFMGYNNAKLDSLSNLTIAFI